MNKIILGLAFCCSVLTVKADLISSLNVSTGSEDLSVVVDLNATTEVATITIEGPSASYFAIGFDGNEMLGTYAIVCNQATVAVEERLLGDHNAGSVLQSSLTVESSTVQGERLTLVLSRSFTGPTTDHFDFSALTDGSSASAIYAVGINQTLMYHGGSGKGITSMTFNNNLTATERSNWKQSIQMYPNPATSSVNIQFERASGATEVQLMTVQGQSVLTKSFDSNATVSLSLEGVQTGTYMLVLKNEEHEAMFQLIKE